jgi:outer membrane protein assembly factor BamB
MSSGGTVRIKALYPLALLILAASLASAQTITRCGGPTNALYINWPTFHFDVCHTGNNPYEHILSPATVAALQPAWRFGSNLSSFASPTLVNGLLYFYVRNDDTSESLYALNATTGAIVWQDKMGADGDVPTFANGVLYAENGGGISALDPLTGTVSWAYSRDGGPSSSPTVSNGRVYSADAQGFAYALDARTGTLAWESEVGGLPDTPTSSPAVVNGIAYYGAYDNNVYALNAQTGTLLWKYATGGFPLSPTVFESVVYVGSEDKNLYALDALTGGLLWKFATGGGIESTPAIANGAIYFGSLDGYLYALDASSGVPLWKFHTTGMYASPAVANGVIYFPAYDGANEGVYALDAGTGAVLWENANPRQYLATSSPVVANGVLYVGTVAGVTAFQLPGH